MLLGMNTVIFGTADLETALQHVAWAGYGFVELSAIAGMSEHVKIGDDPNKIKEALARTIYGDRDGSRDSTIGDRLAICLP